jgi:hypothetical protein
MRLLKSARNRDPTIDRTTLRVYWYVVEHGRRRAGVRAVQRALGFKSPSSAIFHLEKLNSAHLLQKEASGDYVLLKRSKFGVMNSFAFIGNRLIPKCLFYALLVSTATTLTAAVLWYIGQLPAALALLPSIIASVILWIETLQVWNAKPRFRNNSNT